MEVSIMDNNNPQNNSVYRPASPSVPAYNNASPVYTPYRPAFIEDEATINFREKMARKLGLASIIYAVFGTFCLYKNLSGITMPFFGIATLAYMIYGLKLYEVEMKRTSWFYGFIILALSVSNFLTGNPTILFFNTCGIFLMLFIFLLHNVYDDSRWSFSKTAMAICEAFTFSFGALDDFGKDMKVLKERSSENEISDDKKHMIKYVGIGLLVSIPVVGILLALLAGADVVFSNILSNCFVFDFHFGTLFGITTTFVIIFLSAYCIMRFFSKKTLKEEVEDHRNLEPLVAITVLSMVSVIYLIFSMIQIVYLFLGGGQLPYDYTYSQYAREGFFQLLTVSIINFLMVLFVNNHFKESKALKVLMTTISLCTYIMIASSFVRIMMYIDACLLTELRIWVVWGLTVLTLLFAAVIISIFKHEFPLFKYCIIVVSVMYVIIGFVRMDYVIADYNLTYMDTIEDDVANQDYEYLKKLSTDAAPAIYKHDPENAEMYIKKNHSFYEDRSWRQFNISAYTAELLAEE